MSAAAPPGRLSSSSLLLGVTTGFLVVASLASLVADRDGPFGADWSLRGSLVPSAEAGAVRARGAPAAMPARAPLRGTRKAV